MAESSRTVQEVKHYLESVLSGKENLQNISVNILGNSEKGDGFVGDIVFVEATGTDPQNNNAEKTVNLVLKCSKKSQAFRELLSIKQVFTNEIFLYEAVVPDFTKFQLEKNIPRGKVFDNVPKFYGKFVNESMEVIVFENLKKLGFGLWDRALPLTAQHLAKVMQAYAKFHAVSAAMQDQQPERFDRLSQQFGDIFGKVMPEAGFDKVFLKNVQAALVDLQGHVSDEVLKKFSKIPEQFWYIFGEMRHVEDCVKVLIHGDCWNNNFMWKHNEKNGVLPEKVAILDWQLCGLYSPIFDLSYFLFACISEEDAKNVDSFLDVYYKAFAEFLRELGSDPEKVYAKEEFFSDWKKYARFGVIMSTMACQMAATEKGGIPDDFAKMTEEGRKIQESFVFKNANKDVFRKRMGAIVQYSADHGLFD